MKTVMIGVAALGLMCASGNAMALTFPDKDYAALTPSRLPEMVFHNTDLVTASGKLAAKCMDWSWTVTDSSTTAVQCNIPFSFWQSFAAEMAYGNQYSTPVQNFIKVTLSQVGHDVRVQAQEWNETQFAFGQVRKTPQTLFTDYNAMMRFMRSAGADYIEGTKFPIPYMGIANMQIIKQQIADKTVKGAKVGSVEPDSVAADAKVLPGDILLSINGKDMSDAGFIDLSAMRAIGKDRMDLIVFRHGEILPLNGKVVYRPTEPVYVAVAETNATPAATTAPNAPADPAAEIEKYAALRDKGLITEEEYQAKKRQLLGMSN